MKVCRRLLLLVVCGLVVALPARAAQTGADDLPTDITSASEILAAVQDPTYPPELAAKLVTAAASPAVEVANSLQLYQALQQQRDLLTVVLTRDIVLDDNVWGSGQPIVIQPGRVVVLKSVLNTDSIDSRADPAAIPQAGAKALDFAQREEAIIVQTGGLLAFDGVILRGTAPTATWLARLGNTSRPYGLFFTPSVICEPGCLNVHVHMFANYYSRDCSATAVNGNVYRGGILAGNTSRAVLVNETAYLIDGAASFQINLRNSSNVNLGAGSAGVVVQDSVYNCNATPDAMPSEAVGNGASAAPTASGDGDTSSAPGGGGGSDGLDAWAWTLVGVAAAAAAGLAALMVLLLKRRRRAARAACQGAGSSKSQPGSSGELHAASSGQLTPAGPSLGDKDLEKALPSVTGGELGALQHLKDAWRSRIGVAHGLEFMEPIGRGGFATVWKARWRGSIVAVKLIEHGLSASIAAGIRREAALSTSVSHLNVVATYKVATLSLGDLLRLQPRLEVEAPPSLLPAGMPAGPAGPAIPGTPPASPKAATGSGGSRGPSGRAAAAAAGNKHRFLPRWLALPAIDGSRGSGGSAPASGPVMLSLPTSSQPAAGSGGAAAAAVGAQGLPSPQRLSSDDSAADDDSSPQMGATLIVQEYCSRSVEDCLQDGRVLYWPEDGRPDQVAIVRMLVDAAQGLDYLALAGIVHGDVKAGNVLLCGVGSTRRGWQAKISDLGLSRMLPPEATSMAASTAVGTVAYMAPECLGEGRVSRAADVFSFGMLMYEVWARGRAWPHVPLPQLIYMVVAQQQRPPIPDDCPEAYARLMQQCWAQQPADRPTFEGVLKALRALLGGLLQAGVPDTAGRKVQLDRPPIVGSML